MMNDPGKRKGTLYSLSFEKKVKQARSSKAKGELIKVNPENVWKSIESERPSQGVTSKIERALAEIAK